jgi:hypothetical protein
MLSVVLPGMLPGMLAGGGGLDGCWAGAAGAVSGCGACAAWAGSLRLTFAGSFPCVFLPLGVG